MCYRFNIDDHLIFSQTSYKGRLITETNIQEYISNIVSKYLPADVSQWQMFVIPCAPTTNTSIKPTQLPVVASTSQQQSQTTQASGQLQQHYYILVRIHHLLLEETPELRIRDLLLLNPHEEIVDNVEHFSNQPPLLDIVPKPTHIPRLFENVGSSVINRWNEFTYCFDPSIRPLDERRPDNVLQLLSTFVFIAVGVAQKFYRGFNAIQDNILVRTRYFQALIKEESSKRDLTWDVVCDVLSPINAIRDLLRFWCWLALTFILSFPFKVALEFETLLKLVLTDKPPTSRTFIRSICEFIPMSIGAIQEAILIIRQVYTAPMLVIQGLFEQNTYCNLHSFQKISLCGRKVVAWSEPVDVSLLKTLAERNNLSDSELVLSVTSSLVTEIFHKIDKDNVPSAIDLSFTSFSSSKLRGDEPFNNQHFGLVCLSLPLQRQGKSLHKAVRAAIIKANETQLPNYLLSKYHRKYDLFSNTIPVVWLRLLINYLSRKYPIMVTQIFNEDTQRNRVLKTLWGHPVKDLLCFPPPQSNICESYGCLLI